MKKASIIALFLLFCSPALANTYKVTRVIDGDTVVLNTGEIILKNALI